MSLAALRDPFINIYETKTPKSHFTKFIESIIRLIKSFRSPYTSSELYDDEVADDLKPFTSKLALATSFIVKSEKHTPYTIFSKNNIIITVIKSNTLYSETGCVDLNITKDGREKVFENIAASDIYIHFKLNYDLKAISDFINEYETDTVKLKNIAETFAGHKQVLEKILPALNKTANDDISDLLLKFEIYNNLDNSKEQVGIIKARLTEKFKEIKEKNEKTSIKNFIILEEKCDEKDLTNFNKNLSSYSFIDSNDSITEKVISYNEFNILKKLTEIECSFTYDECKSLSKEFVSIILSVKTSCINCYSDPSNPMVNNFLKQIFSFDEVDNFTNAFIRLKAISTYIFSKPFREMLVTIDIETANNEEINLAVKKIISVYSILDTHKFRSILGRQDIKARVCLLVQLYIINNSSSNIDPNVSVELLTLLGINNTTNIQLAVSKLCYAIKFDKNPIDNNFNIILNNLIIFLNTSGIHTLNEHIQIIVATVLSTLNEKKQDIFTTCQNNNYIKKIYRELFRRYSTDKIHHLYLMDKDLSQQEVNKIQLLANDIARCINQLSPNSHKSPTVDNTDIPGN